MSLFPDTLEIHHRQHRSQARSPRTQPGDNSFRFRCFGSSVRTIGRQSLLAVARRNGPRLCCRDPFFYFQDYTDACAASSSDLALFICDVSSALLTIAGMETRKTLHQSTIAAPEDSRRISPQADFATCSPKTNKKIICRMPCRRLCFRRLQD